ncbi:MAG TPA: hypothetical protein VJ827_10690 [Rubrobacter sp.]|nr:hypothetical protein [Rubrobacter sp.]
MLKEIQRNPVFRETLLEWETRFCEQSSVLEASTHMIVAVAEQSHRICGDGASLWKIYFRRTYYLG